MTDIESRLHHAIEIAKDVAELGSERGPCKGYGIRAAADAIESALRAAVEEIRELRADRERLDWTEEHIEMLDRDRDSAGTTFGWTLECRGLEPRCRSTIREAIDAARAQAEEGGGDE